MKTARVIVTGVAAALAGFVGGVIVPSAGDAATAPTVYSYTILGTDSHTLNPHVAPDAMTNGGVATLLTNLPDNQQDWVLEAGLDLPIGAKIKSIAITHVSELNSQGGTSGSWIFGYADPAGQSGVALTNMHPPATQSHSPATYTQTGNPITTIAAGRRYVLDWHTPGASSNPTVGSNNAVWYGATFKYTCVAPCHP